MLSDQSRNKGFVICFNQFCSIKNSVLFLKLPKTNCPSFFKIVSFSHDINAKNCLSVSTLLKSYITLDAKLKKVFLLSLKKGHRVKKWISDSISPDSHRRHFLSASSNF